MIALLLAVGWAAATVEHEHGVWSGQSVAVDLRRPEDRAGVTLTVDVAERVTGTTAQGMVRAGAGVVVRVGRTDWTASAGYAVGLGHPADGGWRIEHRGWQAIQVDARLEGPRLTGRVRLEERVLPGSEDVQLRVRAMARVMVPIGDAGWGVSIWDEALVRVHDTDLAPAGFDQDRWFAGPYVQVGRGVRAEVGYLGLLSMRGEAWVVSHVASAQLTVSVARPAAPAGRGG